MNESDPRLISGGYWDDISDLPVEDWQYEVANGDTRLGYHDWLTRKRKDERWDVRTNQ